MYIRPWLFYIPTFLQTYLCVNVREYGWSGVRWKKYIYIYLYLFVGWLSSKRWGKKKELSKNDIEIIRDRRMGKKNWNVIIHLTFPNIPIHFNNNNNKIYINNNKIYRAGLFRRFRQFKGTLYGGNWIGCILEIYYFLSSRDLSNRNKRLFNLGNMSVLLEYSNGY